MNAKPFGFDSIEASLGPVVAHLGGIKAVACDLWPTLDAERASRRLADQLNPERPEKLDLADYAAILRMGRKRGCDTGAAYLTRIIGYADPQPLDPDEEARRVEADLLKGMEHLQDEFAYLRQIKNEPAAERSPGSRRSVSSRK